MRYPVSAVFIARNEEMVIAKSLDAVKDWVDEIILMDMQSTDATVEIARSKGATVFTQALLWNFGIARTHGIKKAKNEWILILDADEIVSNGLAQNIISAISKDEADLLLLPRANFAFSTLGLHESQVQEYLARCFKKNCMKIDDYQGEVHLTYQPRENIRIKKLDAIFPESSLYHITNPTIEFFIEKINRYSTAEAREQYTSAKNRGPLYILLSGIKTFFFHYVTNKGFKNGWQGFWISIMFAFYKLMILGKLWEMKIHKGKYPTTHDAREKMYDLIADALKKNGG